MTKVKKKQEKTPQQSTSVVDERGLDEVNFNYPQKKKKKI